jgi:hypothetical protein
MHILPPNNLTNKFNINIYREPNPKIPPKNIVSYKKGAKKEKKSVINPKPVDAKMDERKLYQSSEGNSEKMRGLCQLYTSPPAPI